MTETRANTYTAGAQARPSAAMDRDGDFVVVWSSNNQEGFSSNYGIYGQRYNADGVAQGTEFLVNTYTSGSQSNPSVSMDSLGNFVVVWQSNGQDGSSGGVYGQRYNASGVAQGGEFQINSFTSSAQSFPSIAMDADGDFVVVWQSNAQEGLASGYGVYGKRYNSSGVAQGTEFLVNTFTSGAQRSASVAMDRDGDFVVVWQSQDGGGDGIYGQRYNATGVAQGGEFRVNTYTTGAQSAPSVAMDRDGDFVVVWESSAQDFSLYGIYGQRYNAAGVAQGREFSVNTYSIGNQKAPSVAIEADGDFVVAWQSNNQDLSGYGIYSQWYRAGGTAEGSETRVNTYTLGAQREPVVAMARNGAPVFAWQSNLQDGNGYGVYMTTYTNPTPTCFLRGTLILTARGEVAVETLREDDVVTTLFGGLRPVRWIGTQRFPSRFAGPTSSPIRFAPGSLGQGIPGAELFVSPGHAVLVGKVLAHAGALVNGTTITQPHFEGESIDYFHLDLGEHDCVLANGAWAESYCEDHNRDSFHNAADFHARFADHQPHRQETCLTIVTKDHPLLPAVTSMLTPRPSEDMLTGDPDIHFLADGRRLEIERLDEGTWATTLPAGIRSLRLCSRSVQPCMVSDSPDNRVLGVMVRAIDIEGLPSMPADHPALRQGWHGIERQGSETFRWTNGDAAIPMALLGASDQPLRIAVRGWHAPRLLKGAA